MGIQCIDMNKFISNWNWWVWVLANCNITASSQKNDHVCNLKPAVERLIVFLNIWTQYDRTMTIVYHDM